MHLVQPRAEQLLAAWVSAVEELADAAARAAEDPAGADAGIALLHALDARASEALAAYRDAVLGRRAA